MILSKKVIKQGRTTYRRYIQKDKDGTHSIWNLPINGDKSKAILVNRGINHQDIKHLL